MVQVLSLLAAMAAFWIAGYAALARATRVERLRAERSDRVLVLRPSLGIHLALASLALVPVAVVAAVLVAYERRIELGLPALLGGGALVAAGLAGVAWLVAAGFRRRFVVDDFGIVRVGVATRRRVPWRAVEKVTYNPAGRWFFLQAGAARLWIPEDARGAGRFARLALTRLAPRVLRECEDTREVLEELASAGA